jgi:HPt (histidine-containing phosphotransfer) domain-containing protein
MFATLARWIKPTRLATAQGEADTGVGSPPQSPRVDKTSGLANAGGSDALYRRMLNLFSEREAGFVQRFRAARVAGDPEAAMRAAHDLKSEAGTLGMPALEEAAAALERACIDGAGDADVDALLQKASAQLDEVFDELRVAETAEAAPKPPDRLPESLASYSPKDFR